MNDYKMTPGELRATWGLGTVFSLRMLGMFTVWRRRYSRSRLACSLTGWVESR